MRAQLVFETSYGGPRGGERTFKLLEERVEVFGGKILEVFFAECAMISCPRIENTARRDKKCGPPFVHTALVLVVIDTSHRLPTSIYLFSTGYIRTQVRLNTSVDDAPDPTNMPTRQITSFVLYLGTTRHNSILALPTTFLHTLLSALLMEASNGMPNYWIWNLFHSRFCFFSTSLSTGINRPITSSSSVAYGVYQALSSLYLGIHTLLPLLSSAVHSVSSRCYNRRLRTALIVPQRPCFLVDIARYLQFTLLSS